MVGSYLCRALVQSGQPVRAIRRKTSSLALLGNVADKIEWAEGDVLDIPSLEDAMRGVQQVYHCAAQISFIPAEVNHMMRVNIDGTANVMNAAFYSGVNRVVHVSSVAAFGLAPAGKIIDEAYSDPNISRCYWYYRSKHYSEREAWRAHAEGLEVVVACPSTIIGAGWWDAEPNSLFDELYKGLRFYTTATNGFVDVRDVVQCLIQLMNGPYNGERFIISAENRSFREVMFMMADALRVKRPALEAGPFLRQIAWRTEAVKAFFTGKRPLITKESATLASINFQYSNKKITDALGYHFRPLQQTIADTAAVYLQSVKQGKGYGLFT